MLIVQTNFYHAKKIRNKMTERADKCVVDDGRAKEFYVAKNANKIPKICPVGKIPNHFFRHTMNKKKESNSMKRRENDYSIYESDRNRRQDPTMNKLLLI